MHRRVRIVLGSQEMQGDVGFVPHHPAVVRYRWDVENVARAELDHSAIAERGRGGPGEHQSDMLDLASLGADGRTNVNRPLPPWLVGRPADGESGDLDDLE